ncbi:NAD(P)H-quinone oxidoreductase [Pseudooceanicola algae]|uniref:Phthiocerol synthesis polyketide synthase type I PpsC n=1 Tax=Pseudooceanicola algae TaxID=1537215 RepID=A0A418SIL3_9RHOB|nr:NAD(P)H-quinone oxidoreductase [Pseudooceanicola algae]QPM91138.1 Phthiocerol synthesis polyketide synthase type I PpsC [Pseudooceanicola algae]
MRAMEISRPGGPEVLTPTDRPLPQPGPGEVRIRIAYAGVNRPDALQRAGAYDPPPGASDLPGLEASGEITALGQGVPAEALGQRVCALLPGGGYAEEVTTPHAHCLPVPEGMDMRSAACLPETYFTVWSNVFRRAALQGGEVLLVHGGSSGIGSTAIQLATAFGARVFTTAGTPDKCAFCESLGAERAINYRSEDFVEVLKSAGGADVVLDMVGGDYIPRNIRLLKPDGRLVMIAFLGGPKAEVNFAQVMMKRLTVTGSTLRAQSDQAKAEIAEDLRTHVWPLLSAGRCLPVIDNEFPLEEVGAAHTRMESSGHMGKIVLKVGG